MGAVGFDCIVDAGLGRTAADFDRYRVSVFDRTRPIDRHFARTQDEPAAVEIPGEDAYRRLEAEIGLCGAAEVAGASVAAPYVSAVAAAVAVSRLIAIASGCACAPSEVGRISSIEARRTAPNVPIRARGVPTCWQAGSRPADRLKYSIMDVPRNPFCPRQPDRTASMMAYLSAFTYDGRIQSNAAASGADRTVPIRISRADAFPQRNGRRLAQIATAVLGSDQITACYTFGSPRVGNSYFDLWVKPPSYRVMNDADIVPTVPFPIIYRHSGDPRYMPDVVQASPFRFNRACSNESGNVVGASFSCLGVGRSLASKIIQFSCTAPSSTISLAHALKVDRRTSMCGRATNNS